jgi:hypothetical protein
MNEKEQSNTMIAPADETPTEQVRGGEAVGESEARGGIPPTNEVGGPKGLEPTRYGDWENNGRCWDF